MWCLTPYTLKPGQKQTNLDRHEENIDKFTEFLKAKKLRKTQERFAILEVVESMPAHFEVDEVRRALEERGYHCSIATIYSTVELLCQCGILRRLLFNMHNACYELAGRNHIHLICYQCGKVREVDDPRMMAGMSSLKFPSFQTLYFSTCVYGLCSRCSRKIKASHRPGSDDGHSATHLK